MKITSISEIDNAHLCIGCGICVSLAGNESDMVEGSDGFYHPLIDNRDEIKVLADVKKICPGLNCGTTYSPKNELERLWGHIDQFYEGYANDKEIRWTGSSGGGITAVLLYLLESGMVDCIVQTGPSKKNPLKTECFINKRREDIIHCASSRYCPSTPLTNVMQAIALSEKGIAVVGRPCDISALRKLIDLKSEYKSKVFILISFFCASTPSYNATGKLLEKMNIQKDEVKQFWYRGRGWPGNATAITNTGRKGSLSYMESWGKVLSKYAHFRCKVCPDGIGCSADIVFADGWSTEKGKPVFNEQDGKNIILTRTERGTKALISAVKENYIATSPFHIERLEEIQPSQVQKRTIIGARLLALRLTGLQYPHTANLSIYHNLKRAKLNSVLVNFWGAMRRRISFHQKILKQVDKKYE